MACNSWLCLMITATAFGILFFVDSCFSEKAPFKSFAKDATSAPPTQTASYIVIGGGTAGCALAATLSTAESATVLLLERGGLPYTNANVTHIAGFPLTLADTSPQSPSQLFVSEDGVFNHRGRVLGGSSAINAGFFTRASLKYTRERGWDEKLVNASYEWVEKKVAFEPKVLDWQSAVRDGLIDAGVRPYNGFTFDHIQGTKIGGSIFDADGYRHSAADLLEYANEQRIRVYLHATVDRILFATLPGQKPKANGVLFRDSNGVRHVAYLDEGPHNEIIVSSGAIGSPQLLMLSGIGPALHLSAHGIKVVLDQPLVGQGMSDNPMNALIIPSQRPVEISLIEVVGITDVGSYIEALSGFFQLAWARTTAQEYAKSVNQTIEVVSYPANHTVPDEILSDQDQDIRAGIILEKIVGPFSTGHLELLTTDVRDNPRVRFNYFSDPRDLERCVRGMEIIKRVVESRPLSTFKYPFTTFRTLMNLILATPTNLRTKHLESTYNMEQFCIDTVMTIWHYHGGCQVDRVVDRDYRVMGVDSLRVVDGSTFYNSPGTNPQATVMMLGRYVGHKILQERMAP